MKITNLNAVNLVSILNLFQVFSDEKFFVDNTKGKFALRVEKYEDKAQNKIIYVEHPLVAKNTLYLESGTSTVHIFDDIPLTLQNIEDLKKVGILQ